MESTFESLQTQKWDVDKVGCGAVYAYEAASQSTFDIELKLNALGAQLNYFLVLEKRYPALYEAGELGQKLNLRWDAARARSENLLAQSEKFDFIVPEVGALKSIYLLTSTLKNTAMKKQLQTLPVARDLMKEALERDSQVLDGLGHHVMAKLYVDLPVFAGGNQALGLEMYETALASQPNNLELVADMLAGYLAKGDEKRQKELITIASKIDTSTLNKQDVVDLYKTIGGMASRLGQQDAVEHFRTVRENLLENNPQLLSRKATAVLGHGGNDPITGEDPNKL